MPLFLVRVVLMFLLQLVICEVGFLTGLKMRSHFPQKLVVAVLAFLAGVAVLNWLRVALPGDGYVPSHLKGIAYFVALILLNAVAVWHCFEVRYGGALFAVIGGYSIEHIASRFSYIVKAWAFTGREVPLAVEIGVFELIVPVLFSLLFYFLLLRQGIARKTILYNDWRALAVSAVNIVICIVLSIFEPNAGDGSVEALLVLSSNYACAILACTLCLLLQVGYFRESELDEKNKLLEEMLKMEREKQNLSRETIDIINMKCHDLRHQIGMLERQTPEDRARSLQKLSDAVLIYDSILKTGNPTVDLVLMEKKLFCEKYHITFTYLVDGEKLSFMDEADIYAMFGNMLDNAIESVSKEADPAKRIITLTAHARGDMLYLCMENYCSTPVTFQDGIPETVKSDKAFHGFGVKSIAHVAESYGGNVRFLSENNYFIVEALIPLP